ncbi:conserved hypothetical protein [Ricinus communis]|uniref:Uncharacterized protein n=1 Tax=Ricinus communis TaxID=3988 RepID=B9SY76_RICCO|nr:conserved hypothetical protein [Ricinus communis]
MGSLLFPRKWDDSNIMNKSAVGLGKGQVKQIGIETVGSGLGTHNNGAINERIGLNWCISSRFKLVSKFDRFNVVLTGSILGSYRPVANPLHIGLSK